jgi:hypothetical protein
MEEPPGTQYRSLLRVAERPQAIGVEAEVQRLWFEQAYAVPLRTTEGEEVEVLQPGFWNHGGGPDFLHATLRNGRGEVEHGAVEVHLRAEDWRQHHHEDDPHYDPVILHVVWQAGPKPFFPRTSRHGRVRQVEFSSQLRRPLAELRALSVTTPEERAVGARAGRCRGALAKMEDRAVVDLLREAGWHRFHIRVARMGARVALVGEEQALWQGVADALGYAANRGPFGWLARRVPIARAREVRRGVEREALLYGVAGLLPDRRIEEGRGWPRDVWDAWWKLRGEEGRMALPKARWSLRGQRPANRPERRMAVLALLAEPGRWNPWMALAHKGDAAAMVRLLGELEHPYWSRRFTWNGAVQSRPLALLGTSRLQALLYNTLWPLAWPGAEARVRAQLEIARAPLETQPGRTAAFRLLGGRRLGGAASSLLVREGLIQIFQDFCLQDERQCADCEFPEWVARWAKQ